jgi:hypothetical protein
MDEITELLREVTDSLAPLFEQMDWAEDEIQRAASRHRADGDILYHSFPLLVSTHRIMVTEFVYRSHCRELLTRLVRGGDTRLGTAAEVCCLCNDASMVAPLKSPAAGLYFRMWAAAFPTVPLFGNSGRAHEALEGSTIDDYEDDARRKLTVKDRKLGAITCTGRHNGQLAQCKYAGDLTPAVVNF